MIYESEEMKYLVIKILTFFQNSNEIMSLKNDSQNLKIKELKNHDSKNISKIEDLEELNKNLELHNFEIFEQNTKFKAKIAELEEQLDEQLNEISKEHEYKSQLTQKLSEKIDGKQFKKLIFIESWLLHTYTNILILDERS